MIIRLDKYLADMGLETRSGAKNLVRKGAVSVNGVVATKADMKIDTTTDHVTCNQAELSYHEFEYFMLNKPAGVISASNDPNAETVVDLITTASRKDLFPVGRLDKDTVGLLLITNDGKLTHQLLSPKHHVDKTYEARLAAPADASYVKDFESGLDIGDEKLTLPAKLIIDAEDACHVWVTIQEGRYHQIKRMFEACGNEVVYLKRLSMGALKLDPTLEEGAYRPLTPEELAALKDETVFDGSIGDVVCLLGDLLSSF